MKANFGSRLYNPCFSNHGTMGAFHRSVEYFQSENDGFKKGNYLKMIGSDIEKIILIVDLNIKPSQAIEFF